MIVSEGATIDIDVGWRRSADELPPDGMPVIAFSPIYRKHGPTNDDEH